MEDELMSFDDFAASIKAKYPQYQEVDNFTLATKMVEKYPEYADRVSLEKKNPDQNEQSGESELANGTSDSQKPEPDKSTFRKYLEWIGSARMGVPYFGDKTETMKALESGTARMVGGLVGIPEKLAKADLAVKMELVKMFGSEEVKKQTQEIQDKINALPEKERTAAKLKLQAQTVPAKELFGIDLSPVNEWFANQADDIKDAQEAIDVTRKQYDSNIIDDIGSGNLGQASERMFNGFVESVPMMLMTVGTGGTGLAAVGGSVASDKMEDLERQGEMSDIEMAGVGALRGGFEAIGGSILQGIFKPALGKVSKEAAEEITKSFFSRLKQAAISAGKEFAEEASQSAQEELTDALVKGEDINWESVAKNMVDAGLIGAFSTAPSNLITSPDRTSSGQVTEQAVEGGTVPLNIPAVETVEELQTQLNYITNKEDIDPETKNKLVKELNEKITKLESTDTQEVTTPENPVESTEATQGTDTETTEPTQTKLREIGEKSRKQAKGEKIPLRKKVQNTLNNAADQIVDRQASVKRLIRKGGLENTPTFMVANSGASSHAKNIAEKAYNRTVSNLTNAEVSRLEEIIFARRVQAIDENRAARDLEPIKHPDGYNSEQAAADLETYRQELGDAKFNELVERSNNYFDEYKSLLNTMKEEGLITQETYDTFAEVNYQPRQFLDFLEDMHGNFLVEELNKSETIPLSQKQIQSLKEGSEGMLNMDAFGILEASILTRSRAVFSNRLNNTFAEEFQNRLNEINELRNKETLTKEEQKEVSNFEMLEENVKMDRIIGFTESGQPKYAMAKANTKGWSPIYYYINGIKHRMWLKDQFHQKYTDTNNQYLGATARENIALFSGTSSVKTLATGNNPLFFITNTPRDFLFILTFSQEYGNEVISNSFKLFRDAAKGVRDVVTNAPNYDKYLEYGGGMDFLALQGKYKDKGLLKKGVDAVMNQKTQDKITKNAVKRFLDKFNLASEVGLRMAVFNKSINNQLSELGIDNIESLDKTQRDLIYTKAVKQARQLTDFNQGGKAVKALDAGIPYLNAAVQGTRAAASNLKQRPVETVTRMAQITGYTVGMTMAAAMGAIAYFRNDDDEETKGMSNAEIYFETLRGVSQYDLNNYFIVPIGKRDENGNWRYLRMAKSQALTPNLNAAEFFVRKALAEQAGIEYKQDLGDTMMRTFETNILPMEVSVKGAASRVPFFDASMALYGIDSYTGNPLSWDRGKIPEQLEGIVDDRVEPVFKELGDLLGQSPVRLQSAMESYITTPSTNPYVGIMYGMGNLATGDKDFKSMADGFGDITEKSLRRVMKSTSEYNKVTKAKERVGDAVIDAYRKHIETEAIVRKAVKEAKRTGDAQTAIDGLNQAYQANPELLEKSVKWFKSEFKKKRLNPLVSSLRFEDNKEVKALLIADRFGDKLMKDRPDYTEQEKAILKQLLEEKVIDKEVIKLYSDIFNKK